MRSASPGLTLVEVMVALGVFSLLSMAALAVLTGVLSARDATAAVVDDIGAAQQLRALVKADVSQAVARRTRDQYGVPAPAAFAGGSFGEGAPVLALTRAGWINPYALEDRSSLQYVEYSLDDGRLVRRSWRAPDAARGAEALERVIMTDVRAIEVAFYAEGRWQAQWPPFIGPDFDDALPRAVELTVEDARLGRMRYVFLTPGEG